MVDPLSIVGVGLGALASKDLLGKLLGPTADYLGGEIKGLVEKCNVNLTVLFERTVRRLGARLNEPGQINPRVLKSIIDEARFCEDQLALEYFAGVLGSSRTLNGRDDRGLTFAAMIKELSTYQLRLHYVFYSLMKRLHGGDLVMLNPQRPESRERLRVFLTFESYAKAMDLGPSESLEAILPHSVYGLARLNLLGDINSWGDVDDLRERGYVRVRQPEIILKPHPLGVELMLWVHGLADVPPRDYLSTRVRLERDLDIPVPLDALTVTEILPINYYEKQEDAFYVGERCQAPVSRKEAP